MIDQRSSRAKIFDASSQSIHVIHLQQKDGQMLKTKLFKEAAPEKNKCNTLHRPSNPTTVGLQ